MQCINLDGVWALADNWCYVPKTGPHELRTREEPALSTDCGPDSIILGQIKHSIHCTGDPHDHEVIDPCGNWTDITDPRRSIRASDDAISKWSTLHTAKSEKEFYQLVKTLIHCELIFNHDQIANFVAHKFATKKSTDYIDESVLPFCPFPLDELNRPRFATNTRTRKPSLVIIRNSWCGKTDFFWQFLPRHHY